VGAPSASTTEVATTPAPGRDLRDPLTGLPNHVTAHHLIRDLVESLTPFSLALCNVDGFAEYNTRHGRDGGDVALQTLSTVLADTLRPDDIVCRYGGDTFLAVFPRCSTMNAAAAMERVREALVLRLAGDDHPAFTCSSGVADSNQGTSVDALLEAADLAMSMAKYDGGNRVRTASFDAEPGEPDEPADRGAELG
jgi:diguanylate cyclase (GGDEF)-like protein